MSSIVGFFPSLGSQPWLPSEAELVQRDKIWLPAVLGLHANSFWFFLFTSHRQERFLLHVLTPNLEVDFYCTNLGWILILKSNPVTEGTKWWYRPFITWPKESQEDGTDVVLGREKRTIIYSILKMQSLWRKVICMFNLYIWKYR